MDYSKFLDENFDVKEWVNCAFNAHKEGNADQYATTLVMKLQMFIQEVNNVIEESCQQAITNLPRVMRELDAVKQEAVLLQDQMKMVKYDIEKVEHDTAQSMQTLLKLDTIKGRMQAASEALQEADNWTTLSADVDEVFDSGDIDAISQKINGMQQSLHILTDVPDFAERCQFLETLKNKLEALLSTQVVQAFSSQSLELAQKYVKIFSDMERLSQLTKYYHKCHKTSLVQSWRAIQTEQYEASLQEWLTDFYDQLLSTWNSQMKWCGQVFDEPLVIVCDLLTETLTSLDPSIGVCIERHLQAEDISTMETLIALKQVTERFTKGLEGAMETYTAGNYSDPCVERLAAAAYAPYIPYVYKFGNFEEATLSSVLLNVPLDHEDVLDCVRLLGESVSKLFAAATESNARCVQFTNGCGYTSLPPALQNYFQDYVKEFNRVLVNLREKCRPDSPSVEADDWSLFQNSLRIIQTCGDLILHTDELDQTIISSIVTTVEKYCLPSSPRHSDSQTKLDIMKNPFHDYKMLLLDSASDRAKLEFIITTLEEGDNPSILVDVKEEMGKLSETVHRFAFDIVFGPLQHQLEQVPTMEIWTSESQGGAIASNLPTFSLSPQEYITKIGQYLMTLPQQLEPFTIDNNPTLMVALKHGKLPFTADQSEIPEHLAELWLESIARGTMHNYSEQILKIPELTQLATSQLITDIEYLCNVMDDLGLQASDAMTNITTLLKASADQYSDEAENMPQRLTSAIASMRNLSLL